MCVRKSLEEHLGLFTNESQREQPRCVCIYHFFSVGTQRENEERLSFSTGEAILRKCHTCRVS